MVDVRRAYRGWFWRRMSWMLPGLCVAVTVAARLATHRDLELWLRLPALALSGGVALLFIGLTLLPNFVLRARSQGDIRRAQTLRREARSYPTLALGALSVSLVLLAVPLLFAPRGTPSPSSGSPSPLGHRGNPRSAGTIESPSPEAAPVPPSPDPAAVRSDPAPAPVPEPVTPTPAPAPVELPAPAPATPLPPPLPPAALAVPAPVELPSGQELLTLRFRPDWEEPLFPSSVQATLKSLDRAGLPIEGDEDGRPAPELQLDLTILPRSRGWYGAIYEGLIDVPIGMNDSFRTGLFVGSLNDEEDQVDLEASVVWQRVTLEYERRLLGYTRHATVDLAVQVGLSVDRMNTHEASIHVDSVPRPSPWVGIEAAIWEQDGLGLVVRAGHSFALRLNGAAMSSTDVKIELRIDLSETLSLNIGWHYAAVRIHDKGSSGGLAFQELEQSFSGPVGGLTLRF